MKLFKILSLITGLVVVLFFGFMGLSTTRFYDCHIKPGGEKWCQAQEAAGNYATSMAEKEEKSRGKAVSMAEYSVWYDQELSRQMNRQPASE